MTNIIRGKIVDIFNRQVYPGEIEVSGKKITRLSNTGLTALPGESLPYILPGFIDSHVHIESSMLVPAEFAKLAVVHGTVGTVSDPHEIANVCGIAGVEYMISNGRTVPFKFYFGAPSCVPATVYETAGAAIDPAAIDELLARDEINYLSEMMNFPGVIHGDADVMSKIGTAKKYGKPVDGHAPGLRGADAKTYIDAGMSTDHECFTRAEALEKLQYGMKILIREGSAAKNFDALVDLLHDNPDRMMFCSDDKHPDSLAEGHINLLCERAVAAGIDVFKVLQAACVNPVMHYKMDVGLLRKGDPADFILVEDLVHFRVLQTYIEGELVAEKNKSLINTIKAPVINHFNCAFHEPASFSYRHNGELHCPVIEALEGQLITNKLSLPVKLLNGEVVSDVAADRIKIVVVNRYKNAPVAKAFVTNFGLKRGALASTVAHDSHNIIAVGVDDENICNAVNLLVEMKGGVSCVHNDSRMTLALPVAGLMSNEDGYAVASAYTSIDRMAKEELGSTLTAPFMTLSFMALLVIPHLKLGDLGLFDGDDFRLIS